MLFDTDVLIWFLRGNENAASLVQSEPLRFMSQISWMEIIQGARDKRELARFKSSFPRMAFEILPLGESIGNRAIAYMALLSQESESLLLHCL